MIDLRLTARCAFACAALLATGASADQTDPIEALRRENAEMAAKIARLESIADEQGRWLTEARAAEIRELVQDVVADAALRSSLQGEGATAGWDRGFFIKSADDAFKLTIMTQMQFRFAYNQRDVPDDSLLPSGVSDRDQNWGFENRRTRITFSGHMFDRSLTYMVQPVFNRSFGSNSGSANASIDNIWIQKAFDGGWSVRAGQFKAPFLREEQVASRNVQAVERTLINDAFSVHYTQGVQLAWEQEWFRLFGMYSDALRANRVRPSEAALAGNVGSGYITDFQTNPTDYAFSGRAEFKLAGTWRQFNTMWSPRDEEIGILLGVGAMAQQLRGTSSATDAQRMWGVTADATAKFGGVSLFAYGVYREVTLAGDVMTRGGGSEDVLKQWGAVLQGGVFILEDVELFARYEIGNLDTDQFRTDPDAMGMTYEENSLITIGANVFPLGVKRPELRWTTDVGFSFDPLGDFAAGGANWIPDATKPGGSTESDQFVIRSQIQLLF